MTNLSADAPLRVWGVAHTEAIELDNAAALTIYKGQPIIINQSVDTIYAQDWADGTGEGVVAATDVFLGIAAGGVTVKTTDAEGSPEARVEVYVEPTILGFKSTVFTNADLGATVYMSDTNTLSATAADNPQIGKLARVEGGYCYVRLATPQVCTGA